MSTSPKHFDLAGKRVVVTGGAGFLGASMCEELAKRNPADVFVPRSAKYDLVEAEACKQLYADTKPDCVIHLAARVGGIGANREHPGLFFYANLMMGVNLIEEARKHKLQRFVQVGTICSYPKFTPIPFQEDELWNGYPEETNAPYGVAKKALLVQLQAYRQEYGLDGIYLLPVNLYGPRDNFDLESSHVIPAMIRKMLEAKQRGDEKVTLWGDGSPTREFLYVDDAAEGILKATESYNSDQPCNLGTGHEISIRDLAELIGKLAGYKGQIVWDTSKPNGQPRRCLDTSRAQQAFGFNAATSFEDGLKKTIEWWKSEGAKS